eukprot:tig00000093_g3604.t1
MAGHLFNAQVNELGNTVVLLGQQVAAVGGALQNAMAPLPPNVQIMNQLQQIQLAIQELREGQREIAVQLNKVDNGMRGNGEVLPFLDIARADGLLPDLALRVPNRTRLDNLTGPELQQLIAFYGLQLPAQATLEARRRAVAIHLGLRLPFI